MSTTDDRLAYTIPEAAQNIGIGRTTLYAEITAGNIETVTIGRRRLITRQALERYLQALSSAA